MKLVPAQSLDLAALTRLFNEGFSDHQAIGLYEKLGFEVTRDVVVWSLPATGRSVPGNRVADERTAQSWIAARRPSPEPWQRADATLDRMRESGWELRAVTLPDDGEVGGAAGTRRRPRGRQHEMRLRLG